VVSQKTEGRTQSRIHGNAPFGSLAIPEGPKALRLILADDLPLSWRLYLVGQCEPLIKGIVKSAGRFVKGSLNKIRRIIKASFKPSLRKGFRWSCANLAPFIPDQSTGEPVRERGRAPRRLGARPRSRAGSEIAIVVLAGSEGLIDKGMGQKFGGRWPGGKRQLERG